MLKTILGKSSGKSFNKRLIDDEGDILTLDDVGSDRGGLLFQSE